MDRRIKKSKQAIMEALTELMLKKDFEKITINEIADLADVNRGTIYLHYTDKYDLLDYCIEYHLSQLTNYCISETQTTHEPTKISMLKIFEYLERNILLFSKLLSNKSMPLFRNKLVQSMTHGLSQNFSTDTAGNSIPKDIQMQFWVSAIVGVLEWWLVNSESYSAIDITENLWKLLTYSPINKLS